jgi:hypothetical protein
VVDLTLQLFAKTINPSAESGFDASFFIKHISDFVYVTMLQRRTRSLLVTEFGDKLS